MRDLSRLLRRYAPLVAALESEFVFSRARNSRRYGECGPPGIRVTYVAWSGHVVCILFSCATAGIWSLRGMWMSLEKRRMQWRMAGYVRYIQRDAADGVAFVPCACRH